MEGRRYIELLTTEWRSLYDLCSSFTEDQWAAATELPGWTVKDVMAHITGTEAMLLGRRPPAHSMEPADHVKNPIAERNEIEVDYRRGKSGPEVLDEFHEVTSERLRVLRTVADEDLAKEAWTPTGRGTVADLLRFRLVDCWIHEQDIRRVVRNPGHLSGAVADACFESLISAMPYVVGKKVAPPDGTTVIFDVKGPSQGESAVIVEGRRARSLEHIPREADVRLAMDLQSFVCLSCGRWSSRETLRSGLVQLDGDVELGARVVGEMNFMF